MFGKSADSHPPGKYLSIKRIRKPTRSFSVKSPLLITSVKVLGLSSQAIDAPSIDTGIWWSGDMSLPFFTLALDGNE
jgi:hypothetical protein